MKEARAFPSSPPLHDSVLKTPGGGCTGSILLQMKKQEHLDVALYKVSASKSQSWNCLYKYSNGDEEEGEEPKREEENPGKRGQPRLPV